MIDHNNKNFILAIVLSMAIIFGWQYFYAIPIAEQARQETTTAQPNTTTTTTTAQVPGSPTAVTPVTRDQALASYAAPQDRYAGTAGLDQPDGRPA